MAEIENCPYGFADGNVVGYEANSERLLVFFEFWNAERGAFLFREHAALLDHGALGATVGATKQEGSSELIASVVRRMFETPPESVDLTHFSFLDVDDDPILEVVAQSCTFVPKVRPHWETGETGGEVRGNS